jgi:hypothetical protein
MNNLLYYWRNTYKAQQAGCGLLAVRKDFKQGSQPINKPV